MKRIAIAAAVMVMAAGCGKSKEEKRAEEAQKQAVQTAAQTAQTTQQAAQQAANGLAAMAKGLEAAAGGGDTKAVDPVSFRDMMALFPDLDGWEKQKPTGERMTSPMPFSTAEVRYTKGDASLTIKMVDSGFNQLLLMPYAMFLTAGYEKETSDGYEKSTKVGNEPGWEKWSSAGKNGELNALVGKRFVVTIEGSGIEDTKVLHETAGKIDMAKLAALK
jgi:hypothetical protein